jgi:hypothetical protein
MHRRTLFSVALAVAKLAYSQMVVDQLSYETTSDALSHLATPNTSGPKKFRFSRNIECGDDQVGCSGSTIFRRLSYPLYVEIFMFRPVLLQDNYAPLWIAR